MASITTTTADKLLKENWGDSDVNTNEEMKFANQIMDLGIVNKKLHIPLIASIVATTPSTLNNLTFTANTETEATFSPATRSAQVELEKNVTVRAVSDAHSKYKLNLQYSLAAIIDSDCAADAASITTQINAPSGADKASVLDTIQRLAAGAKMLYSPGDDEAIGVLHVSQVDEFLSISDFTSAQFRGDGVSPLVKGWVVRAAGARWYESGSVYTSGGLAYNPVFIKGAFGIGYNQRATPIVESYQLVDRIIMWADFAHNIRRDNLCAVLVTPSS